MGLLDVPDRLDKYIERVKRILHLSEWKVQIYMSMAPNNDAGTAACCSQQPTINTCSIQVRVDCDLDQKFWRETIIHELLHVAMARVDGAVETSIIPQLPKDVGSLALVTYTSTLEPFIHSLARSIQALIVEDNEEGEIDASSTPQDQSVGAAGTPDGGTGSAGAGQDLAAGPEEQAPATASPAADPRRGVAVSGGAINHGRRDSLRTKFLRGE